MANRPIWRDYLVTIPYNSGSPYTDYVLKKAGTTVYQGRAYNRPNPSTGAFDQAATVLVNELVRDYLKQSFAPDLHQQTDNWTPGFAGAFTLEAGGSTLMSDTFYLDWSYDYGRSIPRDSMHDPVDFRLDGRQRFLRTVAGSVASLVFTFDQGSPLTLYPYADSNVMITLGDLATPPSTVTVEGMTYSIDQSGCKGRYVLHYVNAYGGWDCLVMDGEPVEVASYDRRRMKRDASNSNADAMERGTVDYADLITRSWSLRTGLLTADQSERMHHLLGSTLVCLEDLSDGMVYPVVLDDASAEWRTAQGNAGKPVQWAIAVTLALPRERR